MDILICRSLSLSIKKKKTLIALEFEIFIENCIIYIESASPYAFLFMTFFLTDFFKTTQCLKPNLNYDFVEKKVFMFLTR